MQNDGHAVAGKDGDDAARMDPIAGGGRGHGVPGETTSARWRVTAAGLAGLVLIAGGVGVAALSRRPGTDGSSSDPVYASSAAMLDAADLVLRGRVNSMAADVRDGKAVTVARFEPIAVDDGVLTASDVVVTYAAPGSDEPQPAIALGKEYVVVLRSNNDGTWSLVCSDQGVYPVVDGEVASRSEHALELPESVLDGLGLGWDDAAA